MAEETGESNVTFQRAAILIMATTHAVGTEPAPSMMAVKSVGSYSL